MRRNILLSALVATFLSATDARAQTAICQDVTVQLNASGAASIPDALTYVPQEDIQLASPNTAPQTNDVWQSFTPTVTGILDRVSLEVAAVGSPTNLALGIYAGEGVGGALLHSQSITSLAVGNNLLSIIGTVDLTAGDQYTFRVICTAGTFTPRGRTGDPYPGGISGGANINFGPDIDLIFGTRMLQRPSIDNGSNSAAGVASFAISQNTFDCDDHGTVDVTLTMTDKLGNVETCISTVSVEDNIDPVALCINTFPPITLTDAFTKSVALPIPDNDPTGVSQTINIPDPGVIQSLSVQIDITHSRIGDLVVAVESPSGQMVTLIDRIGVPDSPLGCTSDNMLITLSDNAVTPVNDAPCVTPLTGTFIPEQSLSAFANEDMQGVWTLHVMDMEGGDVGLLNSWTLNLEVIDTPGDYIEVLLDAVGGGTLTVAQVDNGSDDNCEITFGLSQSVFNCSHIGISTVTMTVTDIAGTPATCDVLVEVKDLVLPEAICQDLTVILDAAGQGSITAAMVDDGSNDACGIATISVSQEDFDCTHVGDNTVTLTVVDNNGNESTCTATVTVVDDIDPEITCPADIVVCATDNSGAQITFPDPVGSDNCEFIITRTDASGLVSGDVFPVGTTTVSYLITDDGGNTASCSFTVTVHARPVAGFTFTPACVAEAMFFNSTSNILPGYNIISHSYDLGDGSGPVTQVNPIYQYPVGGEYDVTLTVTSGEGCSQSITQTVTVTPGPTADFSVAPVCLGQESEFVNTSIIDPGYTGDVNYTWSFGDASPFSNAVAPSHTYATSGVFTVTLTAVTENGCTNTIQKTATVSALPQAQFTAGTVCEGVATQFNDLSFGTGLTHAWEFGDGETSIAQNPSYIYEESGTYSATLTVTAPGGCQSSITNTVTVIAPPTVAFDFENACAGTSIAFTNSSSAGNYAWNFGDNNSSVLTNPSKTYPTEGFYTVTLTVTSQQSCTASLAQEVEVYRNPHFTLEPTAALCFGEASGSIFVNPIPPAGDEWDISINGGAAVTNQFLFTGIGTGTYVVDVVDENGCEGTGTVTVGQPSAPLALGIPTITHLTCNGNSTGSLEIAASGGTSPYTYSLVGGPFQSSGLFTGLGAGDYYFEATDANGCSTDTDFYTVNQPAVLSLQLATSTNLLCNGDNSGSLAVFASGGTQPYLYNVNGGFFGESGTFTGLSAGQKTVIVRDANGCETPLNVTITEPGILQASVVTTTNALCNGQPNGTVQVAAASGTGPYQFSKDGTTFQGSGLFNGLAAGSYTFTAKDANNCLATVTVTVTEPAQVVISTTTSPVLCFGQSSGTASITATGGTTPYTFSFIGGSSFTTQPTVTSLAAGTYTLIVRDANGCEVSESTTISQPEAAMSLSGTSAPVGCTGETTGSVTLSAQGGTPTYAYSANGVVYQSSPTFSGLGAGTYNYFVQDINGCQAQVSVEVTAPASPVSISQTLVNNPSCGLSADGSVTVIAAGGTPAYTFSTDGVNFQPEGILTGLGAGTVFISVKDVNGCIATGEAVLTAPPTLLITVNNVVGVECAGTFTGQLEVSGEGGIPGYTFSLSGGTPQSSGSFTELTNGMYVVQITDVNGCTASTEVELPAVSPVPNADFSWVLSGDAVFFNNTTTNADSYLWNFGDGTSSTEQSPVHFYAVPGFYTVTLAATNECGTRTRTRTVNTLTIGIDNGESTGLTIYPNPVSETLFLTTGAGNDGVMALEVTNIAGQRMLTRSVNGPAAGGRFALDVSGLGQGMYVLTVQTADSRSSMRFTVIR